MRTCALNQDGDHLLQFQHQLQFSLGMIEQGLLDTLGRCLNGLDQHVALRTSVASRVEAQLEELSKIVRVTDQMLSKLVKTSPQAGYYLELESTLVQLAKLVAGGAKPWRSTFTMERQIMGRPKTRQEKQHAKKSQGSMGDRTCHVCMVRGKVGTAVKLCKQCRTVVYCSTKCQQADWKTHRKECIAQKGTKPMDTHNEAFAMMAFQAQLSKTLTMTKT